MEEGSPFIKHHRHSISRFPSNKKLCLVCTLLFLLVLVCISAVCIGLLLHFFLRELGNEAVHSPITLEDLSNASFSINRFSGQWSAAGDFLFTVTDQGLEKFDPSDDSSTLMVSRSEWEELRVDSWSVSPSLSYLLLAHNLTKLYRHSYTADYSLLEISVKRVHRIVGSQWRVVEWVGQESLVLANTAGLFYIKNLTASLADELSGLRAADGELVGYPDWVYEEEILSSNSAVWSTPDPNPTIAFLVFNSTGVPEATITRYGADIGPYPSYTKVPYPKAGDRESGVQLFLASTSTNTSCQIAIPAGYHYVQSVEWVDGELALRLLNREQTNVSLSLYSTDCQLRATVYTYETENGWIESNLLDSISLSDGSYLALLPVEQLNDKFMQIVSIKDGSATPLTSSTEVRSLLAVHSSDRVFFTSGEYSYLTNVYYFSLSSPGNVTCVNCRIGDQLGEFGLSGSECAVASASFSPSADYFVLNCLGPDVPFSLLVDSSSLRISRLLEKNSALNDTLASISLPSIEPFEFTKNSTTFYGTRMVPVGFSESQSHPVLLYVYGGPNSQLASLVHSLAPFSGYMAHLVSAMGFVVVTMEGRGTCCRGENFRFSVKDRLGVLEAEDQISLAEQLLSQSWARSVSVMGASYGGYLSGMSLATDSSVLSAGVVISPVTDWRYYDSVYTQRYMGTPQDNPQGYNASSLILRAGRVDGNKLLLIHGSADDNVHYQNSAELSLALKLSGQQFRMHTYFNENHHLRQTGTRAHLYQLLDAFLKEKVLS